MNDYLRLLQLSVLIPIITWVFQKDNSNTFLIFINYLLILSLISDTIGTFCAYVFHNNLFVIHSYFILNIYLSIKAWRKLNLNIKMVNILLPSFSYLLIAINLIAIYFSNEADAYTVCSIINIVCMISLGLIYYINKILNDSENINLSEPEFLISSAFILFGLSSIVLQAYYFYVGPDISIIILLTKQFFYLVYNIIISLAFYLNYQNKKIKNA